MKSREVIKILKSDGWHLYKIKGSHAHFKHPVKSGKVTVPVKKSKDIHAGTLSSIFRQASIERRN